MLSGVRHKDVRTTDSRELVLGCTKIDLHEHMLIEKLQTSEKQRRMLLAEWETFRREKKCTCESRIKIAGTQIGRRKGGGLRPEGQIRQGKAKKRNLGEQSTERLDRLTLNEVRPVETYLLSVGKDYDQHTPS